MIIYILRFKDEESALRAFAEEGKTLDDPMVMRRFSMTIPSVEKEVGSTFYFVIVNTIDIPLSIQAHEYDYSYPVAINIDIA